MSRPVGPLVTDFTPPPPPGPAVIAGRFAVLERLDPDRHAGLHDANGCAPDMWDYMPYGPFVDADSYRGWQARMAASNDPFFYAIRDKATDDVGGVASFMRIDTVNGVIEIGHIAIAPPMQRTPASSEAIMLMIAWAFGTGYRRVEWKCNDLNAPSMRAADRYGFQYEGTFRKHLIVKGRNRDTAWWAMTDDDWPRVRAAYDAWLAPGNFDANGRQIAPLAVGSHAPVSDAVQPLI